MIFIAIAALVGLMILKTALGRNVVVLTLAGLGDLALLGYVAYEYSHGRADSTGVLLVGIAAFLLAGAIFVRAMDRYLGTGGSNA